MSLCPSLPSVCSCHCHVPHTCQPPASGIHREIHLAVAGTQDRHSLITKPPCRAQRFHHLLEETSLLCSLVSPDCNYTLQSSSPAPRHTGVGAVSVLLRYLSSSLSLKFCRGKQPDCRLFPCSLSLHTSVVILLTFCSAVCAL